MSENGRTWLEKDEAGKQQLHGEGVVVTDETCSECSKVLRWRVNFDVNGNHIMVCPHCGHKHCRTIKEGVVTNDRWSSRNAKEDIPPDGSYWNSETVEADASTAARYIRERFHGRLL